MTEPDTASLYDPVLAGERVPYEASDAPLLEVDNLFVEFHTGYGIANAVNGVSYSVNEGETLAVLGESGSGKSVTAQAIMGILDMPPAKIPSGEVRLRGQNILALPESTRRKIRGDKIAMIFQDALSSLNPVYSVGWQIAEMFTIHQQISKREGKKRAIELMERVRIPGAKSRVDDYPHEFSGGMRQRIMIAVALALDPEVLIADEPTTALDVTVQAQVMELLADLQRESSMGLILITHDLGVVADVADKTVVMYAGRAVEKSPIIPMYANPAHPYTKGLLNSIPRLDLKGQELDAIKGIPPNLMKIPSGCEFAPRCPRAQELCREERPQLREVTPGRFASCHFSEEVLDD